ncbi:MAG: hypothetical protein HGB04_07610 [Chlorobiaceae bacterium]|nr:hypothetical protein [Chlorobiaceae bacterium]
MHLKLSLSFWLLITAAESVKGTVRRLVLVPAMGELPAHQAGVAIGCVIIFSVAWLFAGRSGASSARQCLATGVLWVFLTLLFEFGLGSMLGYAPARMLADYDLCRGGRPPEP